MWEFALTKLFYPHWGRIDILWGRKSLGHPWDFTLSSSDRGVQIKIDKGWHHFIRSPCCEHHTHLPHSSRRFLPEKADWTLTILLTDGTISFFLFPLSSSDCNHLSHQPRYSSCGAFCFMETKWSEVTYTTRTDSLFFSPSKNFFSVISTVAHSVGFRFQAPSWSISYARGGEVSRKPIEADWF